MGALPQSWPPSARLSTPRGGAFGRLCSVSGAMDGANAFGDRTGAPRVVAVRYGTLAATRSAFFLRHEDYGEPDGPQSLDYYLWVVGEGAGALVVDTGFDPGVAARRGRTCLCPPREALERL